MKGVLGWFCLLCLLCLLSGTAACQSEGAPLQPSAEVGVFFGGEVQRLKKVEITPVRPPKIGFRVVFPENVPQKQRSEPIEYEVVRPGPAGRRVTKMGKLKLPEGQQRIDHVIAISPVDKLGVWNVRVVQGDVVLADRALYLVAAATASTSGT